MKENNICNFWPIEVDPLALDTFYAFLGREIETNGVVPLDQKYKPCVEADRFSAPQRLDSCMTVWCRATNYWRETNFSLNKTCIFDLCYICLAVI